MLFKHLLSRQKKEIKSSISVKAMYSMFHKLMKRERASYLKMHLNKGLKFWMIKKLPMAIFVTKSSLKKIQH